MKELIKLRKSKKMTQGCLASAVGVGSNTISQYEKGKRIPNAVMLKKIAEVLGCSVDDLLKES